MGKTGGSVTSSYCTGSERRNPYARLAVLRAAIVTGALTGELLPPALLLRRLGFGLGRFLRLGLRLSLRLSLRCRLGLGFDTRLRLRRGLLLGFRLRSRFRVGADGHIVRVGSSRVAGAA